MMSMKRKVFLSSLLGLSSLCLFGLSNNGNNHVHADTNIYTQNVYITPATSTSTKTTNTKNHPHIAINKQKQNNKKSRYIKRPIQKRTQPQQKKITKRQTFTKSVNSTSKWHSGIPNKMSSSNGWISNPYKLKYRVHGLKYVRYTTPLYNGKSYAEGFNARPHYYKYYHSYAGNSKVSGNTLGAKNSQVKPYYKYLSHNKYSIISGNNYKNGLYIDLDMSNHPWKKTYFTPNYITVRRINHNTIEIWNKHKFVGIFHRMTYRIATDLGY